MIFVKIIQMCLHLDNLLFTGYTLDLTNIPNKQFKICAVFDSFSSHGSSKKEKEKARFEAQKQRARQVQQKPDIITPSFPLFGAPKKVDTPDESSQKIQRVLGKYNEVRPFENTGPIIGVSPSTPSTPVTADPKHGFFSSGSHQRVNGQHKQSDSSGRKPDPNRSFNIPNAHSSSRESASSNTRKSLPHFQSTSSHPSHDKSKSRSPVKVHPFSHSSPAKPANPRPSVSPVTTCTQKPKKLSLDSYRAALDASNNKSSSLNTSTISQDSKSPTDHQQSTHKSMKPSGKGPMSPPNGIVSENARSGVRPPKLVIPDTQSKNADILDEIFNEMTIQPPLTGIHTPRKTEDKFPFPTTTAPVTTHKTSKVDDVPLPSISTAETEVKDDKPTVTTSVTKSPPIPHATVEAKPKPDLAERRGGTTAMKPSNINRVLDRLSHWISRLKKKTLAARCRPRTPPSSSSDSSSSGSESGSDSDSNNSGSDSDSDDDEDEKEEKEKEEKEKDESKEKEEIKKDLDKSVDSTSSTESQPNQPKWSLVQFINKPKTSPLSNTSTGSKPSGGSKIDEENSAMLDDLVTSKSLKDIGPSSTLPFDIPISSDSDDDVTLPGCDADRLQNGENSESEICHRISCSPSALSSSSSDSDTCDVSMSKPTGKHPVKRQRQSSSIKSTNDKVKKDGKSLKKSHSSVNNLKSTESKHKEERKRKLTSTKRKKILSREIIDSDSDIDVDVVSVTPDTKHTAPMSSNLSDHNQNDKLSITKQLFSSPKNSHDSSDSKLNNSQSSSGKPSKLGRHKDDVEHKKHLYKKNHKDNVKKIIPDCYKSSDEDESTDCAQDVEEIFESTEDFRPPSLHSPLPSYPFGPCKNMTSPSTDNKSLALQELSIKSLPSQKSTKSPISKHDIKNQIVPSKTDESVVVKINLSLIKNLKKEPVKKSEPEPIKKLTKDKKEPSVNVDVKSSESSSGKENVKKLKKVSESVDDCVSVKKEIVTNVVKASPVKVTKKESDSVKQSTIVKLESETVSKKSSKLSESMLLKEEVKKDKDSTSSKKESKEPRTKETKASKRKSESSLSNDNSAKKHKSSSSTSTSSKTSSSSSSHSTSNSKKSSSNPTENGIDIDTEDEKRPHSRSERRNSTSSTSSRHSNKSNQSKKPKLESKSSKESSSDKTKKSSTPVHQNGIESNNHHIPFSKYSDSRVPSSPAKSLSSSSKPQIRLDEHSVDHYLSKGKELKHKADPLRDKQPLQSYYTYTEAVLAYIQGAYSMEQKKTEPQRVFTLYNETLHLLKWFTSNIKLDSAAHDKKLSGLIYRIQSILYLKMYYLKKNEGLKFKKIIESHEQSKVTKAPHAPSPHQGWNRSTGIPSPMSPTPSPAGSIGSVGSQGSCELSANKPNGTASSIAATANSTPMASPGSVSIPQRIHSVTQQYITISGYLVNARELWDKAEIIAKECHSFFDCLNKQASPLIYTPNSSPQLVHYVQKGLQCLKDT
ncbi:hypothetical protein LOTGIDRAFT_228539 [Lottia gigantea]|uniref:AF4/FMR2 family member lilli n=1 Tax=Lottia gigantea TaxID=225164 RepID=V3ZQR7_LOTGI|nr:hypothetical protein LOTGIDRAFT_228539 [Lottia gigantea]ESO93763.1 hypothetical protein LOTGIDRAFT_228539 [Lottia gigantea]